jgi:hypothetical protein
MADKGRQGAMCQALIGEGARPCKARHNNGKFCKKHSAMISYGSEWEKGTVPFKRPEFYIYLNWKKQEKIQKTVAPIVARLIQKTWRRVISDPSFLVCRNRLLREFHSSTPI